MSSQSVPARPGSGGDGRPHLQRGRQPRAARRPAPRRRSPTWTSWSSTTAPRTAPARSPTSSRPPTPPCTVLHRTAKEGLGAAYLHGFAVALERGYDVVGEMDADGSHQPEQLHRLLDALRGRRPGDRLALGAGRQHRQLAAAPRAALARRQPLHPAAARASPCATPPPGYRLFRRTTLERIDLDEVASRWATSSRPTWPSAPCRPGCAWSRCRSSSSSASAASPR